jgi:hypothetical protein
MNDRKSTNKVVDFKRKLQKEKGNKMYKTEESTLKPGRLLSRKELENFDEIMKFENTEIPADKVDISRGVEEFLKEFRKDLFSK